jgi:recombination protein RecA
LNDKRAGVLDALNKKYGARTVVPMSDTSVVRVEAISTGSVSLDIALGIGGFPRGRVVELAGAEQSGKTTLSLSVCAQAQKKCPDLAIGFVDVEHSIDKKWVTTCGVDLDRIDITQPDSGEQAFDIMYTLINSGQYSVVVLDSVAALLCEEEKNAEFGKKSMALRARLMSHGLRKLVPLIKKRNTLVIFINQYRLDPSISFGDPRVMPGGLALKYAASVRLALALSGAGYVADILKSKVATPWTKGVYTISPLYGVDPAHCVAGPAKEKGIVEVARNGWARYGDYTCQGEANFWANMQEERPELLAEIMHKTKIAYGLEEVPSVAFEEDDEIPEELEGDDRDSTYVSESLAVDLAPV